MRILSRVLVLLIGGMCVACSPQPSPETTALEPYLLTVGEVGGAGRPGDPTEHLLLRRFIQSPLFDRLAEPLLNYRETRGEALIVHLEESHQEATLRGDLRAGPRTHKTRCN